MKQLFQDLRRGNLLLEEIPAPSTSPGHLLVATTHSLISPGTERMLLEFGKAGYLSKAKQQPEKLAQLYQKLRTDGLASTFKSVISRLDTPIALGYCNVGRIIELAPDTAEFALGNRVVSNSKHAQIVNVPKLLCARIPDEVDDESAAFTVLGAIALEGIRLLQPELGETVAVFGLGVIGLLAVQLLRANGVRVLAFDPEASRTALAERFAAEAFHLGESCDPVKVTQSLTCSKGVDGVLICASTKSDALIHQAAQICRKRGRIVLTGTTGLKLHRSDFYEKELSFQVSCAYGPGRHDPEYEEHGHDYPIAYSRWTIQRNFESILRLMKDGLVDPKPLISRRISFEQAQTAYDSLEKSKELGIMLIYGQDPFEHEHISAQRIVEHKALPAIGQSTAVIGPGSFAQLQIIPRLKKARLHLKWSVSPSGVSAANSARKFGFEKSSTLIDEALKDPELSSVFISTRHDSHARLVIEALKHKKHVYVEKPLCLNEVELDDISEAYLESTSKDGSSPILMVGFNRRFSPLTRLLLELLGKRTAPLSISLTCNAGFIPREHWVHSPSIGGGRIVGELCHFIDLLSFVTGSRVSTISAFAQQKGLHSELRDSLCVSLQFDDGSIAALNYFSDGNRGFPKEHLEVFSEGRTLQLENFRHLRAYGVPGFSRKSLWRQDKGHQTCINSFIEAVRNGKPSPIPFADLVQTMKATFAVQRCIEEKTLAFLQVS